MSLLQADLPSEDEADDDYDPARDDKDEVGPAKAKQSGAKRRRGSVAYPEGSAKESASDIEAPEHIDEFDSPATFAKKSKVDQLWAQLNKGKAPQGTATALRKEPEAAVPNTATPVAAGSKHFNLAAFCRPIPKKQKVDSDSASQALRRVCYELGSYFWLPGINVITPYSTGLEETAWHDVKPTRYTDR